MGVEHAVQRSTKALSGGLATLGDGTLLVSDRRTLFLGSATLEVPHDDVLGLAALKELCVLNHRDAARPALIAPQRDGALVAASINAGWRNRALVS